MSTLSRALLEELSDEDLQALADRLRPLLMPNAPTAPKFMTVAEAAEHLRCPTSRIYALTSANRIPHHKDGSRLLFAREELDAYIRAGGATRP